MLFLIKCSKNIKINQKTLLKEHSIELLFEILDINKVFLSDSKNYEFFQLYIKKCFLDKITENEITENEIQKEYNENELLFKKDFCLFKIIEKFKKLGGVHNFNAKNWKQLKWIQSEFPYFQKKESLDNEGDEQKVNKDEFNEISNAKFLFLVNLFKDALKVFFKKFKFSTKENLERKDLLDIFFEQPFLKDAIHYFLNLYKDLNERLIEKENDQISIDWKKVENINNISTITNEDLSNLNFEKEEEYTLQVYYNAKQIVQNPEIFKDKTIFPENLINNFLEIFQNCPFGGELPNNKIAFNALYEDISKWREQLFKIISTIRSFECAERSHILFNYWENSIFQKYFSIYDKEKCAKIHKYQSKDYDNQKFVYISEVFQQVIFASISQELQIRNYEAFLDNLQSRKKIIAILGFFIIVSSVSIFFYYKIKKSNKVKKSKNLIY